MPAKGWKTVNVREVVYKKLEKKAEEEGRNVTNMVERIIEEGLKE